MNQDTETHCPRCQGLMQREDDGVSFYNICRTCGFLGHLDRRGRPYAPDALAPDDLGDQRGLKANGEHQPRAHWDGCRHHPQCATCPFADCIAGLAHPTRQKHTPAEIDAEMAARGGSRNAACSRLWRKKRP